MKIFSAAFAGVSLVMQLSYAQDFYADFISVGSGYFSAVNNSTAVPVEAGYFAVNSNTVLGVDLHIKKISASVFGAANVGVTTVTIFSYYGYVMSEHTPVKPYIAGGFLLGLNGLSADDVTRQRPDLIVKTSIAESVGILAVVGIQYSLSKNISLFSSYRFCFDYLYAHIENDSEEYINLGGHYISGGLRMTINSSEDL